MKTHLPNIYALVLALAILVPVATDAASKVSFDNRSGKPALVKLVGPTSTSLSVGNNKKATVAVAPGHYFIKIRYGTPGTYSYSKGDEFDVTETATMASDITITLHKVVDGNYHTDAISEAEFASPNAPDGKQGGKNNSGLSQTARLSPVGPVSNDNLVQIIGRLRVRTNSLVNVGLEFRPLTEANVRKSSEAGRGLDQLIKDIDLKNVPLLRKTVADFAAAYPDEPRIIFEILGEPDPDLMKDIAGNSDSRTEGTVEVMDAPGSGRRSSCSVTWYKHAWLEFGVAGDAVRGLRVNLGELREEDKKEKPLAPKATPPIEKLR